MKAIVSEDLCICCGLCEETCPEVFVIEGEVAKVRVEEVPEELLVRCREAVDSCPTDAIRLEEQSAPADVLS